MRPVLAKLFGSGPVSAKTSQRSAIIQELESKTASAPEGDAFWQERDESSALKSEKVSCTFDSIGRRNETLRAQLESLLQNSSNAANFPCVRGAERPVLRPAQA